MLAGRVVALSVALLAAACAGKLAGGSDAAAGDASSSLDGGHDAATRDGGDASAADAEVIDAVELACDPGFSFTPDPPATGSVNEVRYTSTVEGYVYVGLTATGGGSSEQSGVDVLSGSSPWLWRWFVVIDSPGVWSFSFTANQPSETIASCEVVVVDTGPSPPLPAEGSCEGKFCGQDDGEGGTCSACLMVEAEGGACMDPASPISPDGPGSWACLDNAGCDSGSCRIWCPGEPCDNVAHPDGCPQGVEACWVDPWITDYEEACRQCCQSRYHTPTGEYACWDDEYNVCRYPTDCGTGPPIS